MTIILPAFRCGRAWERAPLLPGSTLQSQRARASFANVGTLWCVRAPDAFIIQFNAFGCTRLEVFDPSLRELAR
jgi:hypothetical protein